jgi:hypothetical protein
MESEMNVLDFEDKDVPTPSMGSDRLFLIFCRQKELMEKYHTIELNNGLLQHPLVPVDIHSRHGQARLKDFAWRVTEELTEAIQAYMDHKILREHYIEELSDAYHFLVELTILSDVSEEELFKRFNHTQSEEWCRLSRMFTSIYLSDDLKFSESQIKARTYLVIHQLGLAMNCLKNKPWKNTHMLTDVNEFKKYIVRAHKDFIRLCLSSDLKAEDLYMIYFKKSEVNKFRQRSNY